MVEPGYVAYLRDASYMDCSGSGCPSVYIGFRKCIELVTSCGDTIQCSDWTWTSNAKDSQLFLVMDFTFGEYIQVGALIGNNFECSYASSPMCLWEDSCAEIFVPPYFNFTVQYETKFENSWDIGQILTVSQMLLLESSFT
jgi:hypothetical protein